MASYHDNINFRQQEVPTYFRDHKKVGISKNIKGKEDLAIDKECYRLETTVKITSNKRSRRRRYALQMNLDKGRRMAMIGTERVVSNKTGQVRVGLAHEGFRTIIYF